MRRSNTMKVSERRRGESVAKQVLAFKSGNEMAALAGAHINFGQLWAAGEF
jgi:hypothetical protein